MFVPALPMDFPCNYDWVKHVLAKMEILIEQTTGGPSSRLEKANDEFMNASRVV